ASPARGEPPRLSRPRRIAVFPVPASSPRSLLQPALRFSNVVNRELTSPRGRSPQSAPSESHASSRARPSPAHVAPGGLTGAPSRPSPDAPQGAALPSSVRGVPRTSHGSPIAGARPDAPAGAGSAPPSGIPSG